MAQDDHLVGRGNSPGSPNTGGSGNNRTKTPKQKKIPQRGLGVAQLEKLRIEEQRKKEALQAANALANNAIGPGNDSLQGPIPASPSPPSFLPSGALYRSPAHLGPSQITKQSIDRETGLPGMCNWSRLWTGEYNSSLEGGGGGGMENERNVVEGFTFTGSQVNANPQFDPNSPIYHLQRPPPPMVNVSSAGMSPPPVSRLQIEPPSIQNVRVNNYTPSWPEDDKIVVGSKRSHPFSLEGTPPTPSFPGTNFHHSSYGVSRSRSDELAYLVNEPRNKYTRDFAASNSTEQNPREDARLIGDFLSLAPPIGSSFPSLNLKNKHHPFDFSGHHHGLDLLDNRSFSGQEKLKGSSHSHQPESSSSKDHGFSFFPIRPQNEHSRNGDGEKGEKLDLDLKL